MRSLRRGFQLQDLRARRKRAARQRWRAARRARKLAERGQRLAYQNAIHRHRMADRQRRLDAAHRERVRGNRAMRARRLMRLQARS